MVWNQEVWCLWLCSSFSWLLWLFRVFCSSIQILEFFFFILAVLGLHGCARAFSSCSKQELISSCGAWASHCGGFFCGAQALGWWASVVAARGLYSCGYQALEHRLSSCGPHLVAPWHVGSSCTRDQTCLLWIGKWILYHWATREAQEFFYFCGKYHWNFDRDCVESIDDLE